MKVQFRAFTPGAIIDGGRVSRCVCAFSLVKTRPPSMLAPGVNTLGDRATIEIAQKIEFFRKRVFVNSWLGFFLDAESSR